VDRRGATHENAVAQHEARRANDKAAIQKMLGRASAAMTLDIYADLFDDDLEAVATALDQARSRTGWAHDGPADR
jgi:integrase